MLHTLHSHLTKTTSICTHLAQFEKPVGGSLFGSIKIMVRFIVNTFIDIMIA